MYILIWEALIKTLRCGPRQEKVEYDCSRVFRHNTFSHVILDTSAAILPYLVYICAISSSTVWQKVLRLIRETLFLSYISYLFVPLVPSDLCFVIALISKF
uniref:Uncharacterized protein n=1 Tax=Cacopsylla melanoneura TaxID=428564 RepID=A0A8D8T6D9_9HEMI